MNYIWSAMIIVSLIFGAINQRLDETIKAAFYGAQGAVDAAISMAGVFLFWCGILKISEKSGFSALLSKIISVPLRWLFPKIPKTSRAFSHITMNVTANLMGMGNAATPAGIDAMCELDKLNGYSPKASDEMCMFVVLNTASLQLIPTTIISLRAAAGSQNPGAVLVPVWIVSATALLSACIMMTVIIGLGRKR